MSVFRWFGDKVTDVVMGVVDRRLQAGGEKWLAISRSLAPVRTGNLRSMESFSVDTATHTLHLILGAPYDVYTEFGTRNMAPRPHVRPALNELARMWGGSVSMDFAAPANHAGLLASTGGGGKTAGFAASASPRYRPLTHGQLQHVERNLIPSIKSYHRGNVKRARFRVG